MKGYYVVTKLHLKLLTKKKTHLKSQHRLEQPNAHMHTRTLLSLFPFFPLKEGKNT